MIIKAAMRVRKNMKFGISIPGTYYEAFELMSFNWYTYWQDATNKEMNNVKVAFKFIDNGSKLPVGFKKDHMPYHI